MGENEDEDGEGSRGEAVCYARSRKAPEAKNGEGAEPNRR